MVTEAILTNRSNALVSRLCVFVVVASRVNQVRHLLHIAKAYLLGQGKRVYREILRLDSLNAIFN